MTTTPIDDELDELEQARRDELADDDAGERMFDIPKTAPAYLKVCDRLTPEGEVCGATISSDDYLEADDPAKSAAAAWARHVRIDHPKDTTAREKAAAKKAAKREKAPSTEAPPAPPRAAVPSTERATMYGNAIAQYAFMAYLVPSTPVDQFDLSVFTAGAPMLGGGLAGIAERHKVARQLLDSILGEGGGPYGATLMAALAIAAPIMAHHGHLSPEVGARWGQVIGIVEVPPPPTRPAPSSGAPTTAEAGPAAPEERTELDDDAFGEAPVDPRNASPDVWPSDLPETPSGEFTPLGADEPTFARDAVRDDATAAHAFA